MKHPWSSDHKDYLKLFSATDEFRLVLAPGGVTDPTGLLALTTE